MKSIATGPVIVVLLIVASAHTLCFAQRSVPLSEEQRNAIIDLATSMDTYQSLRTKRRPLCEIKSFEVRDADGQEKVQAVTYHFEYSNSLTIRTIIDVTAMKVLSQEVLHDYCPPLAADERLSALDIALTKVVAARAIYDSGGDIKQELMPYLVVDKDSPDYGHRRVRVRLRRVTAPKSTVTVAVDLTEGDVESERHSKILAPIDPAATIERAFPLSAAFADQQTAWRITFGTTHHGQGEILYIQKAFFRRTHDGNWVQILGDCRLAEMFVPYNNGTDRYYDVTAVGGDLIPLDESDLGPLCLGKPELHLDKKVAFELHDGQNLWFDNEATVPHRSRRAEELHLWSVMPAGNYAYPMLYVFRSDGSVGLYVAATSHNLENSVDDPSTHLHMGCWRLNVALGDQAMTRIETVRFTSSATLGAKAKADVELFNNGMEGGVVWKAEEFTRLRISSTFLVNDHDPAHPVSLELVPVRQGNARTYGSGEEWTANDFGVTLPVSAAGTIQDRYSQLPSYVKQPRKFDSQAAVIWCQSALVHRPRDEDFGPVNYDADEGLAITKWTGFELQPRNLFAQTPLYP